MTEPVGAPGNAAGLTPSQTVGPFLHIGLPWDDGPDVVGEGAPGAVLIAGRVLDGSGDPVPDALIETWQADAAGRFDHPDDPRGAPTKDDAGFGFRGFGRCPTDAQGWYWIRTVKPGPLPTPDGRTEAPHVDVSVLARGLLDRVVTRIYFGDEERANAGDPVLSAVDPSRRDTLIAEPIEGGYIFDIRLQGDDETVFFEV
ncbi:MAG: protocatechuate 3,4-dioxygenase, alpha subunit [Micromonosporaceae bacterium]|nr:protocatechuate 3,4-dioxygenase, alpha subunit [Micromonosporaceae bacterium]